MDGNESWESIQPHLKTYNYSNRQQFLTAFVWAENHAHVYRNRFVMQHLIQAVNHEIVVQIQMCVWVDYFILREFYLNIGRGVFSGVGRMM